MTPRRPRRSVVGSAVLAVLALAVGGCDDGDDAGSAVRGSGTVTSEERTVSGFDRIVLQGSGELTVDVGGSESLELEAEDNLLPLLTTEVRGSTLELGTKESISPTRPIAYTIGATSLEGVEISGSGGVVVPDLECGTFEVVVSGAGRFDLGGTCDGLDVTISGTAELDGADLNVAAATVDIAGSGDVLVRATDDLRVVISGSGSVEYIGDPTTEIDIRGAGSVRRRA